MWTPPFHKFSPKEKNMIVISSIYTCRHFICPSMIFTEPMVYTIHRHRTSFNSKYTQHETTTHTHIFSKTHTRSGSHGYRRCIYQYTAEPTEWHGKYAAYFLFIHFTSKELFFTALGKKKDKTVNKTIFKSLLSLLVVKVIQAYWWAFFTTRNEHAVQSWGDRRQKGSDVWGLGCTGKTPIYQDPN